jgi:hypothetical protein
MESEGAGRGRECMPGSWVEADDFMHERWMLMMSTVQQQTWTEAVYSQKDSKRPAAKHCTALIADASSSSYNFHLP